MTPNSPEDNHEGSSGNFATRRQEWPTRLGVYACFVLCMGIVFGDLLISAGLGNDSAVQMTVGKSLFTVSPVLALILLALSSRR